MCTVLDIPEIVLEQDLSCDSISEYLKAFAPDRFTETVGLEDFSKLLPIFHLCHYNTVRDLHHFMSLGWEKFLDWEKGRRHSRYPLSEFMAVVITLILADPDFRQITAIPEDFKGPDGCLSS